MDALVALPGGEFAMGCDHGRPDERPAHRVWLPPFRAAMEPVSNADYAGYLRATRAASPRFWWDPRFNDPRQPVVGVSWFEAVTYCEWLSAQTGVACRLPTEAEREFAARGGLVRADWPWPAGDPRQCAALAAVARLERPHVPSEPCANGYGLRCLADNVHEWCADWYSADTYASNGGRPRTPGRGGLAPAHPQEATGTASPGVKGDPTGPATGARRASRGGSWRHAVKFTRVSARSSLDPSFRYNDYGFRVYADLTP